MKSRLLLVAATTLMTVVLPVGSPAVASPVKCTITGTSANDVLRGTARADVICGLGGNDVITGLGGNDTLIGGNGNDTLDGGTGNDRVDGGANNDRLMGAIGNDTLNGGAGNDQLMGGTGSDVLTPGSGTDICQPGDRVIGSCSTDSTGPTISEFNVPTTVDAGSTVTFTWRASDPTTVSSTGVTIGWASGIFTRCGFGELGRLISGTRSNGLWSYTCTIPADAVATEYTVSVYAQDGFGNSATSPSRTFSIAGGTGDASSPGFSDVQVVGTARAGETLTTTWTVTDDSAISYAVLWVAGPGGYGFVDLSNMRPYADFGTMVVTKDCSDSGTRCLFTQTVRLDATAPAGTYALWLSTADIYGNKILTSVLDFPVQSAAG